MALSPEAAARKDKTMPSGREVMQHRHFAVIADIISNLPHGAKIRRQVAEHFADELASTNPKFNRRRFLQACDLTPEEE